MARKGAKIALTYFITIMLTLLLIGGVGYVVLMQIFEPEEEPQETVGIQQMVAMGDYTPSAENNKTMAVIYDSEKRMSGCCFLLVRMLADERKIVFMPLPANTYAEVNGEKNTLYEFYRLGGTVEAVKAIEAATGVSSDYYMKLNNESFYVLVDVFGGVDFDIPYNLMYTNPDTGEETIFREGTAYLDSQLLRKVLTYPLYNSGEEYRAKMVGVAANDLLNRNVTPSFATHIDDYFSAVINSTVETDFTAYDYEEQSDAMKYIAESSEKVSQLVTVTGAYDENSFFVLDENFLKSLTERFKLYEEEIGNETTAE